jgi:hypothetical protein
MDFSGLQEPVLLLDVSTLQGPELHHDVSTLQISVLYLEVFAYIYFYTFLKFCFNRNFFLVLVQKNPRPFISRHEISQKFGNFLFREILRK